jgi:hypothetical protein
MRRSSMSVRITLASLRLVLALVAVTLSSCSLLVDTGDYDFCERGALRCSCKPDDSCDPGLECRPPGFCVDPGGAAGADGASQ